MRADEGGHGRARVVRKSDDPEGNGVRAERIATRQPRNGGPGFGCAVGWRRVCLWDEAVAREWDYVHQAIWPPGIARHGH